MSFYLHYSVRNFLIIFIFGLVLLISSIFLNIKVGVLMGGIIFGISLGIAFVNGFPEHFADERSMGVKLR